LAGLLRKPFAECLRVVVGDSGYGMAFGLFKSGILAGPVFNCAHVIGAASAPRPALFFIAGRFDKGSELGHGYFGFADVEAVVDCDFMCGPFVAVGQVRSHNKCARRDSNELEFHAGNINSGFPESKCRGRADKSDSNCEDD